MLLGQVDTERVEVAAELPPARLSYVWAKRLMDVTLALLGIVVLAPLLLLIALLVFVDSRGPVLFVQRRVGARPRRRGRRVEWEIAEFRMLKFRTMVRDAAVSTLHADFVRAFVAGKTEAEYKLTGDVRVTRVGRWLRATSLDELPQLLNVLVGRMSLVGPRPVPAYEVAGYESCHMARLAALPGITGAWQVDGRGRTSFEEMVRMDMEYLRCRSLWRDVLLLMRTVPSVLTRTGAR